MMAPVTFGQRLEEQTARSNDDVCNRELIAVTPVRAARFSKQWTRDEQLLTLHQA
jgi:hypothetical protein